MDMLRHFINCRIIIIIMSCYGRQLNEMRTKLEQLKQLEAAYTEMQIMTASEPGTQSRSMSSAVAEAGTQSQSPRGRPNEAVSGAAARAREAAVEVESVDGVDDESSVPPSPGPPPRPRPPKNYRYIPFTSLCFHVRVQ